MNGNEVILDSVIGEKLEEVRMMNPDGKEYQMAVDAVVALQKAQNEARKIELENERELQRMELEKHSKELDISEAKKERWMKLVIAGVEVMVPAAVYWILFHRGLRFEQTGTVTSGFFRGLTNKIRPTK